MKYLTKEVVDLVNADRETMLGNNTRFEKQGAALKAEFDKCKHKLSKKVVEFYESSHDAYIISFCVDCDEGKVNIRMTAETERPMENGQQKCMLSFQDVKIFNCDITFDAFDSNLARLIYSEMLFEDNGLWAYNILTTPYFTETNIKCKKIELVDC